MKYFQTSVFSILLFINTFFLASMSAMSAPRFSVAMDDMEIIGPFSSWANAKTTYGAVGDGVVDDTLALQQALNELGDSGKASVLYLPAGTYRITNSLKWIGGLDKNDPKGGGGLGIVGESPSNTKILWNGPAGAPMLIQDGGFNYRYSRITWDGNKTAGYGIAHWWDTTKGTRLDGSSEDTDEVFQDMGIGIMAGRFGANYGQLNSEGQVRRVTFLRNWQAGITTGHYNALNWWVWDSHFVDCARGVTNVLGYDDNGPTANGAGMFYVYRSLFERSTVSDVEIGNTGWFSMHNNVSIGSKRFFQADPSGSTENIIIKNNRILDTTDPISISNSNLGSLILIGNQIRSKAGQATPVVSLGGYNGGRDIASINNSYTVSSPIQAQLAGAPGPDRIRTLLDKIVTRSAISSTLPKLQATPARTNRIVFEVTSGADSAGIQAVINAAAASSAVNPIVHLPPGNYYINQTLIIPAKKRLQFAGDALTTILWWQGLATAPMIQLQGPSYASIRDVSMNGRTVAGFARAIAISKADQTGGRIFIEGSSVGRLEASSLAATQLTMQANTDFSKLTLSGVKNAVSIGQNLGPVALTGASSALIFDSWYEGSDTDLYRMDSGTNFTYMGGVLAPASHPGGTNTVNPTILLNNFSGNATFVGFQLNLTGLTSGIGIQVDSELPTTNALFLGAVSYKTFAKPPKLEKGHLTD